MSDMENGMSAGATQIDNGNTSIVPTDYVSLMLKGGGYTTPVTNWYCMKAGDAQKGKMETKYAGARPNGWYPLKLQGAIILGLGGDNSHTGIGTFFEGAITTGCPKDTTEDAVEANIIAAGYGSTVTSTHDGQGGAAEPSLFKINYNQSTGAAAIGYVLHDARRVSMVIVDERGRSVARIVSGVISAGRHTAVWDAKQTPAGVYACRVEIDGMNEWTGKIIVGK